MIITNYSAVLYPNVSKQGISWTPNDRPEHRCSYLCFSHEDTGTWGGEKSFPGAYSLQVTELGFEPRFAWFKAQIQSHCVISVHYCGVCMQRYKNSKACDLNQWVFNETVYIQHQPRQKVGGFEWKNQTFHALLKQIPLINHHQKST